MRLEGIKNRWKKMREAKPGQIILMDNNPYIVNQAISDCEFLLESNDRLRAEVENLKKELLSNMVVNNIERDVDALEKLNGEYRKALKGVLKTLHTLPVWDTEKIVKDALVLENEKS